MICLSLAPVHTVYIMLSAQLTTHEDSIMFPLFFPEKTQVLACFAQDRPRIIGVSGISILHPWRNGLMPWMKPSGNVLAKIADLGRFTVLDGDPVRYVNVY